MRLNKIETHVAWWNEISAGIGLVLGYLCYFLFWFFTPETVIEIEVVQPEYKAVEIGRIPEEIFSEKYPSIVDLNVLDKTKTVIRNVPQFNVDGSPKLKASIERFSGLGKATVKSSKVEILVPFLSTPNFNYSIIKGKGGKGYRAIFTPNEYLKGSDVYYHHKVVHFSEGNSADVFAVRTATIFAMLSLVLFILKIRGTFINWILEIINTRCDSESGDD